VDVSTKVDGLMRRLHASARGQLHQVLIANDNLADIYRHNLDSNYRLDRRPIVWATELSWRISKKIFGEALALSVCAMLWVLVGLPSVISRSLRLHPTAYTRTGPSSAEIILLCTGVANEVRIADWLARKHPNASVSSLLRDTYATIDLHSLIHLPGLLRIHLALCYQAVQVMQSLKSDGSLSQQEFSLMAPGWMVLLSRRAVDISWAYQWAAKYLEKDKVTHLYFTVNYAFESGFLHALPNAVAANVEHGFPRRDVPPLQCTQYVYGQYYADYLRSFSPDLCIKVIGTDYFPKGEIEAGKKTIVVASLQDWRHWGIVNVREIFNVALTQAKENGWKIIFRGRSYNEDAFAQGLSCDWDGFSSSKQESFSECLHRVKPAMVWTTWSTAVLDAEAMGVKCVCFIDKSLYDYFIPDFPKRSMLIVHSNDLSHIPLRGQSEFS